MNTPRLPDLAVHHLGDDLQFLTGVLAPQLRWPIDLFEEVWNLRPPKKHPIMIHGSWVETPRWNQAYGADYHFSGQTNKARPVPTILEPVHSWVREVVGPRLNGLLLNWYDGPGHYIGPHHDSTKNVVPDTPIVTVSFGETRVFRLSHGPTGSGIHNFPAPDGTVFVLPFATNLVWKHSVPKSARYRGRRISVTFRAFLSP